MSGGPYETRALDDVSLTIEDGEFIGLIGHTGSGKSTLVQHLNGLLLPSGGTITVDGLNIADKGTDRRAIRRRVGLVFQYPDNQLFEETVEKDIAFGPRNLGLDDAEIDRRVRDAMRKVAMDGTPRDVFSRGAELRAIGLDVPQAVQLADRLRERGFDVPQGVYRVEEIKAVIEGIVGKGARAC